MLTPAVVLTLFLTGLAAALFHLIWGRSAGELLSLWVMGLIGFVAAQWLTADMGLPFPTIGTIRVVPAMVGCLFGMLVANALKL